MAFFNSLLLLPLSSGDNGSMYFWDWKTGYNFQKIQTTVQPGSLDSEAGIFQCCFDNSGCRLLTAEADKTIKIYKEDDTAVRRNYNFVRLKAHARCITVIYMYIFIIQVLVIALGT
jgi:WD40 repeat protein